MIKYVQEIFKWITISLLFFKVFYYGDVMKMKSPKVK